MENNYIKYIIYIIVKEVADSCWPPFDNVFPRVVWNFWTWNCLLVLYPFLTGWIVLLTRRQLLRFKNTAEYTGTRHICFINLLTQWAVCFIPCIANVKGAQPFLRIHPNLPFNFCKWYQLSCLRLLFKWIHPTRINEGRQFQDHGTRGTTGGLESWSLVIRVKCFRGSERLCSSSDVSVYFSSRH